MLFIKTKLGPSKIHGIGLFADEFIPKDILVQKFIPGVDLELTPAIVGVLPEPAKKIILNYAYKHKGTGSYILNSDNARFLNHSSSPNLVENNSKGEIDVAARDIQIGEELTVDYREFDSEIEKSNFIKP